MELPSLKLVYLTMKYYNNLLLVVNLETLQKCKTCNVWHFDLFTLLFFTVRRPLTHQK